MTVVLVHRWPLNCFASCSIGQARRVLVLGQRRDLVPLREAEHRCLEHREFQYQENDAELVS